jgi:hypothetical protein
MLSVLVPAVSGQDDEDQGEVPNFGEILRRLQAAESAVVQPITIAPKSRTQHDFIKAQRKWSERVLLGPLITRAEGKPWKDEAVAFVSSGLNVWGANHLASEVEVLATEGATLLEQGCDDPLVGYLTDWARLETTEEYYGARAGFEKWLKRAEQLPGCAALARMIACDFLRADAVVKQGVGNVPVRLAQHTAAMWTDGSYPREQHSLYLRHVAGDYWLHAFNSHYDQILKELRDAKLPQWIMATLRGIAEKNRAWKKRGSGYAHTVTPEGWAGFAEHLKEARRLLTRAWEIRPEEPIAATTMITVAMGGETGEGESPRLWFDRAIAAQCDFPSAYRALALAWMPRWGGGAEQLMEFARACAATKRYDTNVPRNALAILPYLNADRPDYLQRYFTPEAATLVLEVARGYVDSPDFSQSRPVAISQLAVYSWLAGDAAGAAAALAQSDPNVLPRETRVFLRALGTDESNFRADVAIQNSAAGAAFSRANSLRDAGDFPAAAKLFREGAGMVDGIAAARLRALADIAGVEARLSLGEWATIPANPSLYGWIQRKGVWQASPDGLPSITDANGPVRIVYGARVGANFELRATVDASGEPEGKWHLGMIFGDQGNRPGRERWYGAVARFDQGQKPGTARMFYRHWILNTPAVRCPLQASNEFTMRVQGGKVMWSLNGKQIHKDAKAAGIAEDARVGSDLSVTSRESRPR